MIQFYQKMIADGRITIEQVPEYWRAQVQAALTNG